MATATVERMMREDGLTLEEIYGENWREEEMRERDRSRRVGCPPWEEADEDYDGEEERDEDYDEEEEVDDER